MKNVYTQKEIEDLRALARPFPRRGGEKRKKENLGPLVRTVLPSIDANPGEYRKICFSLEEKGLLYIYRNVSADADGNILIERTRKAPNGRVYTVRRNILTCGKALRDQMVLELLCTVEYIAYRTAREEEERRINEYVNGQLRAAGESRRKDNA